VEALKPWVRVVVGAWVLSVIPALLFLFTRLIVNAPQIYATAWDSFLVHYGNVWDAFLTGRMVDVFAGLLQIVLLIIPVAGITLIFATIGTHLSIALLRRARGLSIALLRRARGLSIALLRRAGGYRQQVR
jgi:hypothetical protein